MLKEMFKEVLWSHVGKAGLLLLTALMVGVVASIPMHLRDFGEKEWNNPAYWADNPKSVPPVWFVRFDANKLRHQVFTKTSADAVEHESGTQFLYRFRATMSRETDPTFLSFSISDVRFYQASPIIEVFLEDGDQRVFLYRHIVSGRAPDESAPAVRYREIPFRVLLTGDTAAKTKVREFLATVRQEGKNEFSAFVSVDLADARDTVGTTKFVAGGNAFGLLGTDDVGRDIWQGMLFGLSLAMFVGLATAIFTTLIGAVLAGIAGYKGGIVDFIIQRVIDIKTTIPTLILLIFLAYTIGSRLIYVIAFMIVFGWGGLAIYLRPWIKQLRETGFITNARLRGLSGTRIIFRHILPQTMPFLFASFVLTVSGAILAEAGLSFLGLGDPSLPTWGQMLQQGFQTGAPYLMYWWWVLPPGIGIILVSLAFCWIFLALEPYVEPRLKRH